MQVLNKILARLGFGMVLFLALNWLYGQYLFKADIEKYAPIRPEIISSFAEGDIVYFGESSNTSFNPWTDSFNNSIADFMQLALPNKNLKQISHESFHLGLFKDMLKLRKEARKNQTLIFTINTRTFGPSAIHSGTEGRNQQEALFYSDRWPLLTRIFLSFHFYDNRSENERNRLKQQYWRTHKPPVQLTKEVLNEKLENAPDKLKAMGHAFVNEFMFVIDEDNPRLKDLQKIIDYGKQNAVRVVFHILPESRGYAESLVGSQLLEIMDNNVLFLEKFLQAEKAEYINNYKRSTYLDYTDQFYPTEHVNWQTRSAIAYSIAKYLDKTADKNRLKIKPNNFPNPAVKHPLADTLVRQYGLGPTLKPAYY
jgi:hypothetical protein